MDLVMIILSEISQRRQTLYDITYMWILNDATHEPIYKKTHRQNRFVMNEAGGGKMEWEFEVSRCNYCTQNG